MCADGRGEHALQGVWDILSWRCIGEETRCHTNARYDGCVRDDAVYCTLLLGITSSHPSYTTPPHTVHKSLLTPKK
jgi:hypothetical protein